MAFVAAATGQSSLTDWDSDEPATASADDGRLHEQLLLARETIRNLTESLALANSETEVFKRQAEDLQARLDTLGLAAAGAESGGVEDKLLSTVNELTQLQKDHNRALNQLVRLSEATLNFMRTCESSDPGARTALEAELRASDTALGINLDLPDPASQSSLSAATVVDVKPEFGLIIADVGRQHGVRIGMPFQIWRDSTLVGSALVIDARQRLSGAIIQNLTSETDSIQVGDRLRVDARR